MTIVFVTTHLIMLLCALGIFYVAIPAKDDVTVKEAKRKKVIVLDAELKPQPRLPRVYQRMNMPAYMETQGRFKIVQQADL